MSLIEGYVSVDVDVDLDVDGRLPLFMRLPASLEEDGAECGIERAPTERKRETAVIEEVGDGTY